jgi:hypothetical protein
VIICVVVTLVVLKLIWLATACQDHLYNSYSEFDDYQTSLTFQTDIIRAFQRLARTTVFASIVWPHIAFTTLSWQLPIDQLPAFLKRSTRWLVSLMSFDMHLVSPPECLTDGDSETQFFYRFVLTQSGFIFLLLLLNVPRIASDATEIERLHSTNAMIAFYTLGVVTVVQSCVNAIVCTVPEGGNVAVVVAAPDVACDGALYTKVAFAAQALAVIYVLLVPAKLAWELYWTSSSRRQDPRFRASHGWLMIKYRPDCYWFELVMIVYKLTWIISSIALSDRQWLLIAFHSSITLLLLLTVWVLSPFRDYSKQQWLTKDQSHLAQVR